MFRARLAAIFSTSHKMPRLPRNLHLATMRFARTRNKTRLKYCAYHAKWRWTRPKCCACHENCNASSENVAKVLCLPHTATFDTLTKHVWMSQSATPATWNEATRHVKPPKVTPFTELTIGTPIATSHGWLRTVANGCERLGTVANGCAPSSEHTLNPHPQSETGTLGTHSGKNIFCCAFDSSNFGCTAPWSCCHAWCDQYALVIAPSAPCGPEFTWRFDRNQKI